MPAAPLRCRGVSPDDSLVAVVAMNGRNKPTASPFYNDRGKLVLVRASGTSLSRVAEGWVPVTVGHLSIEETSVGGQNPTLTV